MLVRISQFLLFTIVVSFLLLSVHARAQQETIDDIRQLALEQLGPDRLGAAYAAQINFAVNPDISTATSSYVRN